LYKIQIAFQCQSDKFRLSALSYALKAHRCQLKAFLMSEIISKQLFATCVKNKLYSAINIIGLTTGIVCCVLIGLYITNELSYDKFHVNGNRIARITMEYLRGGAVTTVATTGSKVGPQFKRVFPAVEDYARTLKFRRVVRYENKQFSEKRFLYADASVLQIFSFPLLKGDASDALSTTDKICGN
jgi:putative ABC transport system permease protein